MLVFVNAMSDQSLGDNFVFRKFCWFIRDSTINLELEGLACEFLDRESDSLTSHERYAVEACFLKMGNNRLTDL